MLAPEAITSSGRAQLRPCTLRWTTRLLRDLPTLIFGNTCLEDRSALRQQRLEVARGAVDRGLWMPTSRQYDEAIEVLGETFADAAASDTKTRTPLIVKVGGGIA